jgi:hypothetical protein
MILGIDSASAIWDLTQAKAEGYSFTMRYGPPSRYAMSFSECDAIRNQNFGVGHVFEVEADRSLRGGAQGALDGKQHNDWADACGAPSWVRLVYCAQDKAMTLEQLRGPVASYARAFTENCKRPCMPYGSYDCLEVICGEQQINPYGWQTPGWSGYGSGSGGSFLCSDGSLRRLSRFAAMIQDVGNVLGGTADRNVVYKPVDWVWGGQYTGPEQPSVEDDDDMPTTMILTTSRGNRAWLTRKNHEGVSPGFLEGLTNEQGEPIDINGNVLPDGWDNPYAGLAAWESQDTHFDLRRLSADHQQWLLKVRDWQVATETKVTVLDVGFVSDEELLRRTYKPSFMCT